MGASGLNRLGGNGGGKPRPDGGEIVDLVCGDRARIPAPAAEDVDQLPTDPSWWNAGGLGDLFHAVAPVGWVIGGEDPCGGAGAPQAFEVSESLGEEVLG